MKWLIKFLNQPFPVHLTLGYRLKITLGFSLFVTLFMLFFEPVELIVIAPQYRAWVILGYGAICFTLLGIDMLWIPFVFKDHVKEGKWKVYKHLLSTLWLFTTSTVTILFYNYQLGISEFTVVNLFNTLTKIITIILLPSVIGILILYNYSLRVNLKFLEKLREVIEAGTGQWPAGTENIITLADVNQKEILKLKPQELLLIRSADNYVMVYWIENNTVQRKLLRRTMKYLDKQLSTLGIFFRCHRTTIVNLMRVRQITGNALECRLIMEGIEEEIPVSRNRRKKLHKLLLSASSTG